MTEEYNNRIFAKNLIFQLNQNGITQNELARILGVSSSTVSSWCTAQKIPRMDKIEIMSRYFHIKKSDLIEEHYSGNQEEPTPETAESGKQRGRILENFGKLNAEGQEQLANYSDYLTTRGEYLACAEFEGVEKEA